MSAAVPVLNTASEQPATSSGTVVPRSTHQLASPNLPAHLVDQIQLARSNLSTLLSSLDSALSGGARPSQRADPPVQQCCNGERRRIEQLEQDNNALRTELEALRNKYAGEKQDWLEFKNWWLSSVRKAKTGKKRKRAERQDQQSEGGKDADGAAPPTASGILGKLSDKEKQLCERVGIDLSGFVPTAATSSDKAGRAHATVLADLAAGVGQAEGAERRSPTQQHRSPSSSYVLPMAPSKVMRASAALVGASEPITAALPEAAAAAPPAPAPLQTSICPPQATKKESALQALKEPLAARADRLPRHARISSLATSPQRSAERVGAATDSTLATPARSLATSIKVAGTVSASKAVSTAAAAIQRGLDAFSDHEDGHITRSEPRPRPRAAIPESPPASPPKQAGSRKTPSPRKNAAAASPDTGHAVTSTMTPSQQRARILAARAAEMEALRANPLANKGKGRYAREVVGAATANGLLLDLEDDEVGPARQRSARTIVKTPAKHTPTINQQYRIDADRNGGVEHAYVGSERKKSVRKAMHALDCDCCRDYYENIGPLPPRAGPVTSDRRPHPPPSAAGGHAAPAVGNGGMREDEIQAHRQLASRHRAWGLPDTTPPGYWNIGFPDTQQQKEINEQAEREQEKKRRRIEKDPRFVKRTA